MLAVKYAQENVARNGFRGKWRGVSKMVDTIQMLIHMLVPLPPIAFNWTGRRAYILTHTVKAVTFKLPLVLSYPWPAVLHFLHTAPRAARDRVP